MELIKKQAIARALGQYVARYGSQGRASRTLKAVSPATISKILTETGWDSIDDKMWRNVAAQIGFRSDSWEAVETTDYKRLTFLLAEAQANALVMAVTGEAGSGKSFACRQYAESHQDVAILSCNEYWNRKQFLSELLSALALESRGLSVGEMMSAAVAELKMRDCPLIILDEADKLTDSVLYFFITLYNRLEDQCGIILIATSHLDKRLRSGVRCNKKGYSEIWSRVGRKCVKLKGVSAADIVKICEANGVTAAKEIDDVIADSEQDLRRVKRRVHAVVRKHQIAEAQSADAQPATETAEGAE